MTRSPATFPAKRSARDSARSRSFGEIDREVLNLARPAGAAAATIDPYQRGETYRPLVDGVVLPDDPALLFERGQAHRVPFIAGSNADEGVFFAPRVATREQADAWLRTQFGEPAAVQLATLYGLDNGVPAAVAMTRLTGDALVVMGTRSMLRAAARNQRNVFEYEFTRVSPLSKRTRMNAFHAADLGYTFGTLPDPECSPRCFLHNPVTTKTSMKVSRER